MHYPGRIQNSEKYTGDKANEQKLHKKEDTHVYNMFIMSGNDGLLK